MAEYTGKDLFLSFGGTVLSSDFRTFEPEETIKKVDATAGSDANATYLYTVKDGKATCQLVAQTGGSTLWTQLIPGTSGTLIWGEEGTATGKQKHSVLANVDRRAKSEPYDGIVVINVDFQFNGAVTDTAY